MKKLVIALIVFAAFIGAAVYEIIYSTDAFSNVENEARRVTELAEVCVDYKQETERLRERDGAESAEVGKVYGEAEKTAYEAIDALKRLWNGKRIGCMIFGNHTIVKSLDERIATVREQAGVGQWEDAAVTAAALAEYCRGLKDDTHPSLSNLF